MTQNSQDFEVFAGEARTVVFSNFQPDGTSPLDMSSWTAPTWTLQGHGQTLTIVEGPQLVWLVQASGTITLKILPADLAAFAGPYSHRFSATDPSGQATILSTGIANVTSVAANAKAYASRFDLAAYTGRDDWTNVDRQLREATDLIDEFVVAGFTIDATTNLPTNTAVASALRDAVCAQVEYWSEQGEEADVIGQTGTVSVGGATYRAARKIAPRAKRHLSKVGLLSRQVSTTPGGAISSEFFDE